MKNTTENRKPATRRKKVKPVPDGFHGVNSFLVVDGADDLIKFIVDGLGGEQTKILRTDDNKVHHATVRIGDATIMIADTMGDMQQETAMLFLYVDDADSVYQSAIDAGGESIQELKDEFYGDRVGGVKDRWGNKWWIGTHKEEVEGEELERRAKAVNKEWEKQHQ